MCLVLCWWGALSELHDSQTECGPWVCTYVIRYVGWKRCSDSKMLATYHLIPYIPQILSILPRHRFLFTQDASFIEFLSIPCHSITILEPDLVNITDISTETHPCSEDIVFELRSDNWTWPTRTLDWSKDYSFRFARWTSRRSSGHLIRIVGIVRVVSLNVYQHLVLIGESFFASPILAYHRRSISWKVISYLMSIERCSTFTFSDELL